MSVPSLLSCYPGSVTERRLLSRRDKALLGSSEEGAAVAKLHDLT